MDAEDARRHRLFRKLEQLLGPEEAAELMEHLHPRKWDELATKADLGDLRKATTADFRDQREWVDGRFAEEREWTDGRFAEEREWTDGRFAEEREWTDGRFTAERQWASGQFAQMQQQLNAVRNEVLAAVRGEMNTMISTQTRTIVFALVGAMTANMGLVLAAVRLG